MIVKVKGEKSKFVITSKNRLVTVFWDGMSSAPVVPQHLIDLESENATTRLNCGKCDPSNRIWAGKTTLNCFLTYLLKAHKNYHT